MIELEQELTADKVEEIKRDIERLKKLSKKDSRNNQIKALERLLEANNNLLDKIKK
jgi:hypothetical protein